MKRSELHESSLMISNVSKWLVNNINDDDDDYLTDELSLCNMNLVDFPKNLELNNFTKLNLSHNNISNLPESISSLKNLKYLNLSYNNIKELSSSMSELQNLRELNVSQNNLSEMPSTMQHLHELLILNLSGNQLKYLPNSWTTMNSLKTLNISNNLFKKIPSCLQEGMSNLEFLDISKNQKVNINIAIKSRNLKKFHARSNKVVSIFPYWIFFGKFHEMEEINLENTRFQVTKIPISGKKMNIRNLKLGQCQLHDINIQEILINFSSVEYLDIGNRGFSSGPNSFISLPNQSILNPQLLKKIDVSNTGIADCLEHIDIFCNLTNINFEGNFISWLPEEICNLKKLEVLNISSNTIIMLPHNLGSMNSLRILEAGQNHISSLPSSISNLTNLEYLDLFENELTEIPREIGNLKSLKALDFELNYFETNKNVLPKYLDLRNQLRINKPGIPIGSRNFESDTLDKISDRSTDSSDVNNYEPIIQNTNSVDEAENEETVCDKYVGEFDPFHPPPIVTPDWENVEIFYETKFNFCPSDLHPPKIRNLITATRTNMDGSSFIVNGQFDDAD